jgi:DNA-binding transcriptional LysR family regulator
LLITAPVMFGRLHVEPVVLEFLQAYPEISARLVLADYLIDLVENRFDLALRIGDLPDSSLVATRLGAVHWIACASPAYLELRGMPRSLDELSGHDCIAFEGLYSTSSWEFRQDKDSLALPIHPRFSVNTASGAIDAALAGAGITRVLSYQVADLIASGRLVAVLTEFQTAPRAVHLVHTGQPILPLKLRAFIDFAVPRLKNRLAALAI